MSDTGIVSYQLIINIFFKTFQRWTRMWRPFKYHTVYIIYVRLKMYLVYFIMDYDILLLTIVVTYCSKIVSSCLHVLSQLLLQWC